MSNEIELVDSVALAEFKTKADAKYATQAGMSALNDRVSTLENSDSLIKVTAYHANAKMSGLTVQVKQGSTVRYTGITDGNGYAEIRVANGSYTVSGNWDADYTTQVDADVSAPKFGEVSCQIVGLRDGEMTWDLFCQHVQSGDIKTLVPIGSEVSVARGNANLAFQHVAFDKVVVDGKEHNSVLMIKDLFPDTTLQFNTGQAIISAQEAMPAGTYHFNLYKAGSIYYLNANLQNKDVQFTTTKDIPKGGQIVLSGGSFINSTAVSSLVLTSYAVAGSTTPLESGIACSEGTSGTDLGNANTVSNNKRINSTDRCVYGSCRWETSALRQWLNSDKARGQWWKALSPFDRKPSQADSVDGFMYGLDENLVAKLAKVRSITNLNWFDGGGTIETEDYFIVPSRSQIFMDSNLTEGQCWDYFKSRADGGFSDLSSAGTGADSNRIKKRNGSATYWWLRTPCSSYCSHEYFVFPSGASDYLLALQSFGLVCACVLA